MILPNIHIGGSNADSLLEEYNKAFVAADDLLQALRDIDFNSRDYILYAGRQDQGTWETARREFEDRYKAVNAVRGDLETIIGHIMDQRAAR